MSVSQNGWAANRRELVAKQRVLGTTVELTVRRDAPGLLLLEVAAVYDRTIENIDNARGALDDWGYAERPIRGGRTLSNHASGTAVDLNATKHPLGVPASSTFTGEQIDRCHELEAATGHVVRWGGDWSRPDGMHWEIAPGQSVADCQQALDALRDGHLAAPSTASGQAAGPRLLEYRPGRPMPRGDDVRELQHVLNAWYPWLNLDEDGAYGPKTADAVLYLQAHTPGLAVDGIAGPLTRAALGMG